MDCRIELIFVPVTDVDVQPWGIFTSFVDPDGNRWHVQELPAR